MVKITVGIEGMACSMCEAHINEAVRNISWHPVIGPWENAWLCLCAVHEDQAESYASEESNWICCPSPTVHFKFATGVMVYVVVEN